MDQSLPSGLKNTVSVNIFNQGTWFLKMEPHPTANVRYTENLWTSSDIHKNQKSQKNKKIKKIK